MKTLELKIIITEIKILLNEHKKYSNGGRIHELDNKWINIIYYFALQRKMLKKNKQNFRDLWYNVKHTNTHATGITERRVSGTKSS